MSDYASGSLATMLIDLLTCQEWQPDINVNYQEYLKSDEWKERSILAKERAGWRCQLCSKGGDKTSLHTHHNSYRHLGHEEDTDLVVLCRECHKLFHEVNLVQF